MARPVELRADRAPLPAMRKAYEALIQLPTRSDHYEAAQELLAAIHQAEMVADIERQPDTRAFIRGMLGADQ